MDYVLVAASQFGLLTSRQAAALLSRREVDRLLRRGVWRRLDRGVLATELVALPDAAVRRRAALLRAGAGSALCHVSALAEHGVAPLPSDDRVHVSVLATGTLRGPHPLLVVHRRRPGAPLVVRRGVRVVPVAAAVVQVFADLGHDRAVGLVCEVVRQRRTTTAELAGAAAERGRFRGSARFRSLLAAVDSGCESPIEVAYAEVEHRFGLPTGERQAALPRGRRADVLYRVAGVVVELDGAAFHGSDVARRGDIRRDAELAALGLVTLRFTGRQLREQPEWVARVVRDTIAARTAAAG